LSISFSLPRLIGGCPDALMTHGPGHLAQKVTSVVANTAPQLKQLLDLNVTFHTIRNTLRKTSLESAIQTGRALLSRAYPWRWVGSALEH